PLGDGEVRGALDLFCVSDSSHRRPCLYSDSDRESGHHPFDSFDESLRTEHSRMNAARQLAQVHQDLLGVYLHILELALSPAWITRHLVARKPQPSDERDQLLLNPVVEVTLQAPSPRLLRMNDTSARCRQLFEAIGQLSRQLQVAERELGLGGYRGDQAHLGTSESFA